MPRLQPLTQFKMALVDETFLPMLTFSEERMSWCDNTQTNLAQTRQPKLSAMYVSQLERNELTLVDFISSTTANTTKILYCQTFYKQEA